MEFLLQDASFLLIIMAIIGLMGILAGWSLRASLSERPVVEAYERLEQDRNSLARLYSQMKDLHELKIAEIKRLGLEISQLKQELMAYEVEKATRLSQDALMNSRLEKAEADASHYAEKITFLNEQSSGLKQQNKILQQDIERLREEIKSWMTLHRDFGSLQKQVGELETYNLKLEQKQAYLQQELDVARIEIENLQADLLRRETRKAGLEKGAGASGNPQKSSETQEYQDNIPEFADDLKLINGISPFTEQQLFAVGIHTFEQISDWDEQAIAGVAASINCAPEKILEENWVGQARHLLRNYNQDKG